MLELGTELPAFSLPGIDGRVYASDDFASAPGLLVAFLCPHCPFVRHIRHVFGRVTADLQQRGLGVVGINSNDEAAFPMDGIDGMKAEAADGGYVFPYLRDERQSVAKAFRAACTPDLFLFDGAKRLVYRGQFDASRPRAASPIPVTGADLQAAADAVLARRPLPAEQRPSIGCNIKWKPGNEPDYFR